MTGIHKGGPDQSVPTHVTDNAACTNHKLYSPAVWVSDTKSKQGLAQEVCDNECPVRNECLQFTLNAYDSVNQPPGVWGGLKEQKRRRLKRRLEKQQRKKGAV